MLTVISIAVGVCSVVIISTVGEIGKSTVKKEFENMGMNGIVISKGGTTALSNKEYEVIKEDKNIGIASPLLYTPCITRSKDTELSAFGWGIGSGGKQAITLEVLHGRLFSQSDISSERKICMVDEVYAKKVFGRTNIIGKNIDIKIDGRTERLKCVGVVSSNESFVKGIINDFAPYFVYLPYTVLQNIMSTDKLDSIIVSFKNDVNTEFQTKTLMTKLSKKLGVPNSYKVDNLLEQKNKFSRILDLVGLVLSAIAAISLVVSGLGVMTVMFTGVSEKKREIGIKKAIGAKSIHILAEFILEAVFLSCFGTAIGLAAAFVLIIPATLFLLNGIYVAYHYILIIIPFMILFGVVFGVIPAIKAAKNQPSECLRSY